MLERHLEDLPGSPHVIAIYSKNFEAKTVDYPYPYGSEPQINRHLANLQFHLVTYWLIHAGPYTAGISLYRDSLYGNLYLITVFHV